MRSRPLEISNLGLVATRKTTRIEQHSDLNLKLRLSPLGHKLEHKKGSNTAFTMKTRAALLTPTGNTKRAP